MSIISHDYEGYSIDQLSEDTEISGTLIPKGFANATEMCKANGKTWSNYWKSAKAKSFADKVSSALLNGSASVITIEGVKNGTSASNQGTWVHIDVAIHLSIWISDDFAIWSTEVLRRVINGEFDALTEEAKEAQAKLIDLWNQIRNSGKTKRRKLTDAIKDWYERNPGATSRPDWLMYAQTTNGIYLALWGMDATSIEKKICCSRNQLRNYLSIDSLEELERAEANVAEYIDYDNIKPVDAVKIANIRKKPLNFR